MHIAPSATQVYLQNLSMRCFESVNDATYTRLVRSQNQPPSDGSSLYPQVINYNNYSPSYRGHISTLVFTPRPGLSDDSPKRAINVLSMCMFLWVYWGWRQIVLFFFYLYGIFKWLIMYCTVCRLLCCPIRSYYSEAVSEEVMVNDVKHDSEQPDTNAQCTWRFFAISHICLTKWAARGN